MQNLGNRYVNNLPGRPHYEDVPRQKVKNAVKFVNENVFDVPLWLYSKELVEQTTVDAENEIIEMHSVVCRLIVQYSQVLASLYGSLYGRGVLERRVFHGMETVKRSERTTG